MSTVAAFQVVLSGNVQVQGQGSCGLKACWDSYQRTKKRNNGKRTTSKRSAEMIRTNVEFLGSTQVSTPSVRVWYFVPQHRRHPSRSRSLRRPSSVSLDEVVRIFGAQDPELMVCSAIREVIEGCRLWTKPSGEFADSIFCPSRPSKRARYLDTMASAQAPCAHCGERSPLQPVQLFARPHAELHTRVGECDNRLLH